MYVYAKPQRVEQIALTSEADVRDGSDLKRRLPLAARSPQVAQAVLTKEVDGFGGH